MLGSCRAGASAAALGADCRLRCGRDGGRFTVDPGIEKITICEMEPLVPRLPPNFRGGKYGLW